MMKWNRIIAGAALMLALCAGSAFWLFSSGDGDMRSMAKRGATESEMLEAVDRTSTQPNLSVDEIIAMKNDGVPESVIIAMLKRSKR
jgi:hypothetical protein